MWSPPFIFCPHKLDTDKCLIIIAEKDSNSLVFLFTILIDTRRWCLSKYRPQLN